MIYIIHTVVYDFGDVEQQIKLRNQMICFVTAVSKYIIATF